MAPTEPEITPTSEAAEAATVPPAELPAVPEETNDDPADVTPTVSPQQEVVAEKPLSANGADAAVMGAPVAEPEAAEPTPVEAVESAGHASTTEAAPVPPAPLVTPAPEETEISAPKAQPAAEAVASAEAGAASAEEAPKPPRKRAAKKAGQDDGFSLDLGLDDTPSGSEPSETTISSDGATRLLVTAYIGIGNRLFIRGAGPGLSWEKGVPLQFVSIGKWRWETNDASAPVQFKLYKNDEVECAALGAQSVEPGYQQELRAAF